MPWPLKMMTLVAGRTLAISFPTAAEALMGKVTRTACDQRLDWWSRKIIEDVRMELDVVGLEHLPAKGPMVLMSNHQSLYDIPVLYQVVPPSLRMVAKKELFRVPVWGAAMRGAGFVKVDRQNREQAIRDLAAARKQLESGISVWIAPEGTRSRDGNLLPFKKGGFILAEQLGLPIVPVSIRGTRDILAAKTLVLTLGKKVRVTIHPPEEAPSRQRPREEVMAAVREKVGSAI